MKPTAGRSAARMKDELRRMKSKQIAPPPTVAYGVAAAIGVALQIVAFVAVLVILVPHIRQRLCEVSKQLSEGNVNGLRTCSVPRRRE